jgi:hypothetical protein
MNTSLVQFDLDYAYHQQTKKYCTILVSIKLRANPMQIKTKSMGEPNRYYCKKGQITTGRNQSQPMRYLCMLRYGTR